MPSSNPTPGDAVARFKAALADARRHERGMQVALERADQAMHEVIRDAQDAKMPTDQHKAG